MCALLNVYHQWTCLFQAKLNNRELKYKYTIKESTQTMKRLISAISAIAISATSLLSAQSVRAEDIHLGATNDGRQLYVDSEDVVRYIPNSNTTFFTYKLVDKYNRTARKEAFTDLCNTDSGIAGWYTQNSTGRVVFVEANSVASMLLFKAACNVGTRAYTDRANLGGY